MNLKPKESKRKAETVLSCKVGKKYVLLTSIPLRALSTKAVVLKLWRHQNHLEHSLKIAASPPSLIQ